MSARSYRLLYRELQGRCKLNFNWDAITRDSAVVITAAEWRQSFNDPADERGRPFLGDANISVGSVAPHNPEGGTGGVEFVIHVDWDSPLHVQVTITVFDPVEAFQVIG